MAYINLGENKKAKNALHTALKNRPIAQSYQMLSKLVIDTENDFELAKRYLEDGLSYVKSIEGTFPVWADSPTYFDEMFKAYINEGYAYYYLKKGEYSAAIEKYQEVLATAKKLNKIQLQIETLRTLGKILHQTGDPVQSNVYFTMHLRLNDSLMEAKRNSLSFIMQNYIKDTKESKNTIAVISKNRKSLLIKFVIIIIAVSVLVYIAVRIREKRKNSKIYTEFNHENLKLKKRLDKEFDVLVDLAKNNDTSF